mgnify:FL=1|jgi:hypothetical protein|nr:MAG TPA: hypothetical protein [Caudoviricetes sp.]DAW60371.1 MAG TPA: hypothetical protein [Caudoviricetes sp.]
MKRGRIITITETGLSIMLWAVLRLARIIMIIYLSNP